jgi:hypothetical protein
MQYVGDVFRANNVETDWVLYRFKDVKFSGKFVYLQQLPVQA